MLAVEYKALTDPSIVFAQKADRFIHIKSKKRLFKTLDLIEELFDVAKDSRNDPLNDLIGLLSHSIASYEDKQKDLTLFQTAADDIDPSISALRLLMDQYSLNSSDLKEEIGSKSLVSMILSRKRSLTKEHINNLSKRFSVSPSMFFAMGPDNSRKSGMLQSGTS